MLTHEVGFVSVERDVWITADGSLREGLPMQFVLALDGLAVIQVGLECCREDDEPDPEPFGDYFEPR